MKAILLSIWYGIVMAVKKPIAWILYPFAYLTKDLAYGNDVIKNYTKPEGAK